MPKPDKDEPEPMNPKEASRLIGTRKQTGKTGPAPLAPKAPAAKPAAPAGPEPKTGHAAEPVPPKAAAPKPEKPAADPRKACADAADSIEARQVPADEIVDLFQRTPELLTAEWIKANNEEKPLKAKRVSLAEIQTVIGSKAK